MLWTVSEAVLIPLCDRFIASTPAGPYSHRKNSRAVVCSLNERDIPTNRHGWKQEVKVVHYDATKALTKPYHYMFQKISDKAIGKMQFFRG